MSSLRDQIILHNYHRRDEWADAVFDYKTICPTCNCEFVIILEEAKLFRKYCCQSCGNFYREKAEILS